MCDYSLQNVRSRPAKVGDKLTTRDFGTRTRGFAAAEDAGVAVCVLPGTELAFSSPVTVTDYRFVVGWKVEILAHATAIFRQVNKNEPMKHHDALEFPDGRIVLLTRLSKLSCREKYTMASFAKAWILLGPLLVMIAQQA